MQSKLEILLEEKGWSPKDLAISVGCSVQTIYQIFKGHKPYIKLRHQIARAMGVGVSELWLPETHGVRTLASFESEQKIE